MAGRHLVWAQMSVEDLEDECRSRDLHWTAVKDGMQGMIHASSSHKKELLTLGAENRRDTV